MNYVLYSYIHAEDEKRFESKELNKVVERALEFSSGDEVNTYRVQPEINGSFAIGCGGCRYFKNGQEITEAIKKAIIGS